MCCRFWVECLHGHNSLGRSENNEPRQREYGSGVRLVRWPDRPKLSQAVCFAGTPAPALASQRREKLPCNPGGEPQKRPVGCNGVSQSPQHGLAMLSPLCTRGAAASRRWQNSLCLDGHNRLSAGAQYGCSVTPPIPQSAFADSSLCTREPSLPG